MKKTFSLPRFRFIILLFIGCFYGLTSHAQIITTVAGNGSSTASTGDGGPATAAGLAYANSVAVDTAGNIYIADAVVIRKINTAGIITTIGGGGSTSATTDGDGGPATDAYFLDAYSLAIDKFGNVYVSDENADLLRKISPSGVISTVAGDTTGWSAGTTFGGGFGGDGGPATLATFDEMTGIAVDSSGNIYIADYFNERIRKVNTSGIISTIAGNGTSGSTADGVPATSAVLALPDAVAVDRFGNVYIAEYGGSRIRKVNTSGIISTVAGNGTSGSTGDGGPATAAEISQPLGVTVDYNGNIYISDNDGYIRKVNTAGIISTYAGNGALGDTGDGGPATAAEIIPVQLAIDANNNLYIAAIGSVRKVSSCMLSLGPISGSTSLCFSGSISLTDTASGGAWSSSNTSVASVSGSGIVSGLTPGIDTISYTKTNSCGTSVEVHIITVDPAPNAGTITGIDTVCPGYTVALANSATGGSWICSSTSTATVSGTGIVSGVTTGTVSIKYIVSNACGSDTASYSVRVLSLAACFAGVPEIVTTQAAMNIYPNPNRGAFTISISGHDLEQLPVTVTNILGEKVWEMKITANQENEIQLHVPAGVYFISANTAAGRIMQKFVVE